MQYLIPTLFFVFLLGCCTGSDSSEGSEPPDDTGIAEVNRRDVLVDRAIADSEADRDVDDIQVDHQDAAELPSNLPPFFVQLDSFRPVLVDGQLTIVAIAEDPDSDELEYTWETSRGTVSAEGTTATYTAPAEPGDDTVLVVVDDGNGHEISGSIAIAVCDPLNFAALGLVAETEGNSKTPAIASMPDGTLHIVWHDFTADPANLYHAIQNDGVWTYDPLPLVPEKSIFPRLLVQGEVLHLFWQADRESTVVLHSTWSGESWSSPVEVGAGERVDPAVGPDGVLHAVFFRDGLPAHSMLSGDAWTPGDPITIDHTYVNSLRLSTVSTPSGVDFALATSPGGTGYDIRLFSWSESTGWTSMRTLQQSIGYSSDDVGGAIDSDGRSHWVWTEQSRDDEWTISIAEATETDVSFRWVNDEPGFSISPTIAIPPDDAAMVAWMTPRNTIALSRFPYDVEIEIGGQSAAGPQLSVDGEGFTHLTCYSRQEDGTQQIWYTSNRPTGTE